jgi:hypothetical protein
MIEFWTGRTFSEGQDQPTGSRECRQNQTQLPGLRAPIARTGDPFQGRVLGQPEDAARYGLSIW